MWLYGSLALFFTLSLSLTFFLSLPSALTHTLSRSLFSFSLARALSFFRSHSLFLFCISKWISWLKNPPYAHSVWMYASEYALWCSPLKKPEPLLCNRYKFFGKQNNIRYLAYHCVCLSHCATSLSGVQLCRTRTHQTVVVLDRSDSLPLLRIVYDSHIHILN